MVRIRESGEMLVEAWLALSSALWNSRVVYDMTFSEVSICNLLTRNPSKTSTATELCRRTGLLKSQMNRVLRAMENKGHLARVRSQADRRVVYLRLTEAGNVAYQREHKQIMEMVDRLVLEIGPEESQETALRVLRLAQTLQRVQEEKETI